MKITGEMIFKALCEIPNPSAIETVRIEGDDPSDVCIDADVDLNKLAEALNEMI